MKAKKYKRYHPGVWILSIAPLIVLSFAIPFYNKSTMVGQIDFISFFLILMDGVTIALTAAAYFIGKRTSEKRRK